MEEELDLEVIKATQILLGKYIKRPPLTDKLLKKPPFRFLHDIITTVLKTTGFFEGLFDENELISDNVKDRDSKILFLNKVISVISLTTGKALLAKPSKIVSGQEPTRTNELLQCLALALDENLSSHEAVKKYKESKKKPTETLLEAKSKDSNKSNKKGNDKKKYSSKSQNETSHKQKSSELPITKKDKEKANNTTKKKENGPVKHETHNKNIQPKIIPTKVTSETDLQSQNKTQLNQSKNQTPRATYNEEGIQDGNQNNEYMNDESHMMDITKRPENHGEIVKTNTDYPETTPSIIHLKTKPAENYIEIDNNKRNEDNLNANESETSITNKQDIRESILLNSSLNLDNLPQKTQSNYFVSKSLTDDSENPTKPQLEQENNARLPTPIKNDSNIARSTSVRPSSCRPGAPRPKEKLENHISDTESHLLGKVNIIAEHEQNEEEDNSSLIIMEKQENIESIFSIANERDDELNISANEHGHLVQQILESQKKFTQVTGKTEIEWQFGAQKALVAQNQEVELLRNNIQALTRITNPLGKLLDHIQEDVEVMRQELQQWSNIYEVVSKEIYKENALSEDSLFPLHTKLKQLELDVQEKSEKINDLRVLIYKNSSRIEKLLSNGNVQ